MILTSKFLAVPISKSSTMNQVHHIATRLLDFPMEIILDILSHLDVHDLVRARRVSTKLSESVSELLNQSLQVCNDIRQAIDSSSELLYSMDLEYFNATPVPSIPGSDYSIPTLRKSLLQSESAWQKAEYSKRNPIAIPHPPSMHQWSCGVLGFPVESLQQIMFFQPQLADGHSNTINLRQWSCQLDSAAALRLVHYNFSVAEDLVTLVFRAPSG